MNNDEKQSEHGPDLKQSQELEPKLDIKQEPKSELELDKSAKSNSLNKYFLYTIVAGVVVCALVSVFAVLFDGFSAAVWKALGTTFSMVIHTLIMLWLVSEYSNKNTNQMILNTLLLIVVASFITSILSTWDVMTGSIVWKLYNFYIITFLAVLWVQLMLKAGSNLLDKVTRSASQVSIGLTVIGWLLYMPYIFLEDLPPEALGRALAASVILLATSSVLTAVFHRVYTAKHPLSKEEKTVSHGSGVLKNFGIAVIVLFVIIPGFLWMSFNIASNSSRQSSSIDDSNKSLGEEINAETEEEINVETEEEINAETEEEIKEIKNSQNSPGSIEASQTFVDCTELSKYKKEQSELVVANWMFVSINTATNRYYVEYYDYQGRLADTSYSYNVLPKVIDADCNQASWSDLKKGDKINLYASEDYSYLNNGTDYIQMATR